jgi:hypothetical protein
MIYGKPQRGVRDLQIYVIPTGFEMMPCTILQSFHPFGIDLLYTKQLN